MISGCLDAETVVFIKKDGSGTVTETVMFADEAVAWSCTNSPATLLAMQRRRCMVRAQSMGRNTRLEFFRELRSNGRVGFSAIYGFKDVRSLAIDPQPDAFLLGQIASQKPSSLRPVTFTLESDNLVVNFPKPVPDEPATPEPKPQPIPRNLIAEQRAAVRTMFAGFRVRLLVKVDGTIGRTTAAHIEPGNRDTLVLFDLEVAKLLANDKHLDQLLTAGRIDDIDTARKRLAGLPNVRIESTERVEVEF
ncbi:MAG: hypothetical protein WCL44_12175 [bacterium]